MCAAHALRNPMFWNFFHCPACWSGAILMLLIRRESARFNELLAAIPGLSDRLLSERLRELEAEGIVDRAVEGGRPVRVSYKLTDCGRALEPAVKALGEWAQTWIDISEVPKAHSGRLRLERRGGTVDERS
jgi:DNA-binding HxlR family transcriptional regulator